MSDRSWLRPSALPKLALCSSYRSDPVSGEAAARGTKLDEVFRAVISGAGSAPALDDDEDKAAVDWAVQTAHALACGNPLEAREEFLKVEVMGMDGTADLLCQGAGWSADLKTGMKRNYLEQQAAYAIGFMDALFLDEWTVYLFYCDQQEVETLRFNREEAIKLVSNVVAGAKDPGPPVLNDYCGWCAARFTCPVRRESLGLGGPEAFNFQEAASPLLRDFVLRAKIVEEFAEEARGILLERCIKGEKTPGVAVISKRGSQKVSERFIELNASPMGLMDILAAFEPMSLAKCQEIVDRKLPGMKIPSEFIIETPGSSFVRISRPKA